MDSRPYPERGHSAQHHTTFDPYDSRPSAPFSSPSSHSATSTLSSDDRSRSSLGLQQQQPHHGHYPPHDQRLGERMDMEVEVGPRSSGQSSLPSLLRRSSPPSALNTSDPSSRSQHYPSHPSHGPPPSLSTQTGHGDMHLLENARGPYYPPPSSSHHTSYPPSSSFPSGGTGEKEREREKEGESEHTGSGGRGLIGQHPEESLHTLSSLAYRHRHQQQLKAQYQPQHHQQEAWHHTSNPSLPPSPTQGMGSHPHGPSGASDCAALTSDSARHPPTAGSQDRALSQSRLEIKDSASAALPLVSPTFEEDPGRRFSQSHASQYAYRPRPDQEHSGDHYYYDDLQRRREVDRDTDRHKVQHTHQPPLQSSFQHSDFQERHEQRAIAFPHQHRPSDQRYMPSYQEHAQGSYPSAPPNSSAHSTSYRPSSPLHQYKHQQQPLQQQQQQGQQQHQQHHQHQHQQNQHQKHQHQQPSRNPQEGEKRISAPRVRLPNLSRINVNNQGGDNTHDSSYDSNADDDEDLRTFDLNDHNYRFKFGTDMPSTVDLKAAIESCDVLCRFALHYTNQVNAVHDDGRGSSALDPEMRANLQKIRSMNMTMLLGLQNINKTNEKSGQAEESERFSQQDREERETSPLRFGPGPPPHDMVHELAKVATSIFQLAIRIKAWVGMTPEERELDEDINTIRGKRCLLMDSTLAASTVDQNGNVQKDWTIVPAASSISKSFYERQRELEQQRAANSSTSGPKQGHQPQVQSKHDPPHPGSSDRDRSRASVDQDGSSIRRTSSSSSLMSLSMQHTHNPNVTIPSSYSPDSALSGSMFDQGNLNGQRRIEGESRTPKDSDVPYQKYRKRAKRTQPPGRCMSCDSSDTPEWRRGPDGARTLCNACGLHYAKLLKRQGEQAQGPTNIKSRVAAARAQLQGITFPLRRRNGSQATEESAHESGSTTEAVIETKSEPISDSVPGSVSGSGTSSELPENSSLQPSSTQPTVPAPLEPLNREQE